MASRVGAENGISSVNAPTISLLGVFLGSSPGLVPSALDFGSIGTNFSSLSPLLQQVFFIGDGIGKTFTVPTGATQLYLGTMDTWDTIIM